MFSSCSPARSHGFRVCWFALACAPLLAEAVAVGRNAVGESSLERREVCETEGNPDLYGLGVRIGVYWQWVTCFLANRYVPDEISSSLDANAIFLLALLIGMLRNTLMHDQLSLLDALVLLELCFGYLFSVLSLFGYRTRLFGKVYISIIGTYIRLFLAAAICGYSVWFWFEGAEHLNQGDCGAPVMFFFAKVHVLGWIRFLWRVVACFCALYFCTVFLAGFIAFLVWVGALAYTAFTSTAGFREEWRHFWDVARAGDEKAAEVADKTKARRAYNLLSIVNLLFIPWSIVSIELTINWNHLTGVTGSAGMKGSGQLIPALIGIGGFLRIIWIMITNSMDAKKKISDAVNPTPDTTGDNKLESQDTLSPISPSLNRAKTIAFKLNGQLLVDILSLSFLMRLFEKKTGLKEARGDRSAQDNSEDAAGAAGAVKPTDGVTSPVVEVSEKPSGGNNSPS